MSTVIRILRGFCFILGVVFLALALFGLVDQIQSSGETERVGSGQFAMNMPKTTVFQEMGVMLLGIFGGVLICASAGFDITLRLMLIHNQLTRGILRLERQTAEPPRVEVIAPLPITDENNAANDWVHVAPPPVPEEKIKAKCTKCGKIVKGGKDWAGRTGTCPQCKSSIQFPRISRAVMN